MVVSDGGVSRDGGGLYPGVATDPSTDSEGVGRGIGPVEENATSDSCAPGILRVTVCS